MDKTKELVHKVLKCVTEDIDNPDLRDRGFMYWRMLAVNPIVAGQIVLAEKPPITTDSDRMDRGALDQLLLHTGTLGSIYHKNPEVGLTIPRACLEIQPFSQTFIRGAAGKALKDSPALNAHSRAVLVPLLRTQLPGSGPISVPGPGPKESHSRDADTEADVPALPSKAAVEDSPSTSSQQEPDSDDAFLDDDDDEPKGPANDDPYSNLGGAFGTYLADEPKPMGAGSHKGRHGEEEDLLF